MNKLPFFADIPADEYHQAARDGKFLSSHLLGDFTKSPRLYRKQMTGEIAPEDTAAFLTGRAVHTLILEGRAKFDEEFLVSDGPVNPKTGESFGKLTKAYKEWAAAQTKDVVSGADFNFMSQLQQSVWTHPVASLLLDDGVAEQTVRTTYFGVACQIRMDWFRADYEGRPVICDLKTCETLDWFESDARRFGYPAQAAFYREVLRTASDGEVVADSISLPWRSASLSAAECGSLPTASSKRAPWRTSARLRNSPSAAGRMSGRRRPRTCASSTCRKQTAIDFKLADGVSSSAFFMHTKPKKGKETWATCSIR